MKTAAVLPLLVLHLLAAGCANTGSSGDPSDFVKPSIAVMKFENRAAFAMQWDLGSGTRDVLVDRLMKTGRYHVIERPEINEIVKELKFQHAGLTRPEDKAALGKIKNVQYLIKGTITDFAQVSAVAGGARKGMFDIFGSDNRAIVSIILYVADVESGEIVSCESIEESVHASNVSVNAMYKDVSFGGSSFYKTPLGQATAKVIDRAVAKITDTVAAKRWSPKIAAVQPDGTVLLNGGQDRGFSRGDKFTVLDEGIAVVDPETGDKLGQQPAQPIATIRITAVHDRYAEAVPVAPTDKIKVGQPCRHGP